MTLWDTIRNVLASSTLVAAITALGLFLFRNAISRWIGHQFDAQLESVKAEHRRDEEKFKHDLAEQRHRLDALQGGALSGMAARNALLDKRRIEALEKVWSAVTYLQPHHQLVLVAATIGFEKLSTLSKNNPQGRELIETLMRMAPDSADLQTADCPLYRIEREQLFLPPMVWAMFEAYRAVILLPMAALVGMKGGLDVAGMWDVKLVQGVINVALPEAAPELERQGAKGLVSIAGQLKSRLLAVFTDALENSTTDARTVNQAAKILHATQSLDIAKAAASRPEISALVKG